MVASTHAREWAPSSESVYEALLPLTVTLVKKIRGTFVPSNRTLDGLFNQALSSNMMQLAAVDGLH
jgi:hypothetical protein